MSDEGKISDGTKVRIMNIGATQEVAAALAYARSAGFQAGVEAAAKVVDDDADKCLKVNADVAADNRRWLASAIRAIPDPK